jgi:hypothetical protein
VKVRADIAALIREGHSDTSIALRLGCGRTTVWEARKALRLPPADALGRLYAEAVPTGPVVCGTRGGYQKHRRNGEKACDPCRYANAAADRQLRTTGSTVPAAAAVVPAA